MVPPNFMLPASGYVPSPVTCCRSLSNFNFCRSLKIQCLSMSNDHLMESLAIRTVVDNWVLWRDAGDWKRFRSVWHDDGYMMATWFQGTADQFIQVSREGFNRGVNILHFQGAFTVDIEGARAISQTKMTINQRALVHDVLCDVVCTGRFYDFFEKRNNRWGIVLRQPIYEKDRMDPVDPGKLLPLDQELLKHVASRKVIAIWPTCRATSDTR